ncbi:MAG: V-type ATPase subunit [Bacillota bacterium]
MGFDGRFAYAVGRIRALENRMIDQARFSRMIDAETHEELMRVLGETEFGGDRDVRPGASAYEDLINAELLRVHELVASMSPDPALTGVFRARHDFHNMKALLKAALAARDRGIRAQGEGARALSALGWLDVDTMRQAVDEILADGADGGGPGAAVEMGAGVAYGTDGQGHVAEGKRAPLRSKSRWLPDAEEARLAGAVMRAGRLAVAAYGRKGRDPQQIDFVLDRESFRYFFDVARRRKADALLERLRITVDLTNALTCLRLRAMGKGADFAVDALLEGGNVAVSALLAAYDGPDDEFWAVYRGTPYASPIDEGIQAWRSTGSPWTLETNITRRLAEVTARWRRADIGYEPVLGYLLAREAEADRLRRIFLGKMAKLSPQVIRGRLGAAHA